MSEIILNVSGLDPVALFGTNNDNLGRLREAFPDVKITARGEQIKLSGLKKDTQRVKGIIEMMVRMIRENRVLNLQALDDLLQGNSPFVSRIAPTDMGNATIVHGRNGKPIKAKTVNQKKLFEASERNDVVFAVGPAGTGKTYTAVALAVRALKNRVVKKIILTRPAVEAGENLGFLPGDLKDKVDPYLRPLYDALDDMLPAEKLNFFMQTRVIEIAPLAFMRGRTLDNSFIILDEAQNTTHMQIKMFLTRLGPNAKCIITGDLSQVDLPGRVQSGMRKAIHTLGNIDGIATVYLTADDVVRHRLVKEIIKAYEVRDEQDRARREQEKAEREAAAAAE